MAADSQRIVLSFHDSLIRQQDFDLLDSPGWLNDRLIAFYFEYVPVIFKVHKIISLIVMIFKLGI